MVRVSVRVRLRVTQNLSLAFVAYASYMLSIPYPQSLPKYFLTMHHEVVLHELLSYCCIFDDC